MRNFWILFTAAWLAATSAGAQVFTDRFDYPPGPLAGPWRVDSGAWTVTGSAAQASVSTIRQYATLQRFAIADVAVEGLVIHNPAAPATQRGGITVRANNPTYGRDLVVLEVINGSPSAGTGFDTVLLGEFHPQPTGPGGAVGWKLAPHFTRARIRLIVRDQRYQASIDIADDGTWERTFGSTSRAVKPGIGALGLHGYAGARIADFRVFNAVLIDSLAAPYSRPGAVIPLELRGFPGAAYQVAASFGTGGVMVAGGRIPLDLDPLFFGTVTGAFSAVFLGASGRLDAAGDAVLRVAIPAAPALVGLRFYLAFVTYTPGYVLEFSNDHEFVIRA